MKKITISAKDITLIAIFVATTAVFAQVSFVLPASPVPFSLGILAVFICATLLSPKSAVFSQIIYLLLGAISLPVFGGLSGGIGILVGPRGGFLIMYPVIAFLGAFALHKFNEKGAKIVFAFSLFLGLIMCYFVGSLWLSFVTKIAFRQAFFGTVIQFVLFDIIKIGICVFLIYPLKRYVNITKKY